MTRRRWITLSTVMAILLVTGIAWAFWRGRPDPQVEKAYNDLSPAYTLRKQLIRIRKEAGLTQEELAEILHTEKNDISGLENVNSDVSPTISALEEYARAVGYKIEISFVPQAR